MLSEQRFILKKTHNHIFAFAIQHRHLLGYKYAKKTSEKIIIELFINNLKMCVIADNGSSHKSQIKFIFGVCSKFYFNSKDKIYIKIH